MLIALLARLVQALGLLAEAVKDGQALHRSMHRAYPGQFDCE